MSVLRCRTVVTHGFAILLLSSAQAGAEEASSTSVTAAERFASIAQRAVAHQLDYSPTLAYFTGLPAPDHRRWSDRSPAAIAAFER